MGSTYRLKNYKKESHFSHDLVSVLRKQGHLVQRIESGITGRGIPDIYIAGIGFITWIEVKWSRHDYNKTAQHIHWRAGQQAWMVQHWLRAKTICWTLCAFKDCIVALPQIKIYHAFEKLEDYALVAVTINDILAKMDAWVDNFALIGAI